MSRDLPQLAEIARFEAGIAAAAAAMSTTKAMGFFPLAVLEFLGAMARERCACVRGNEHVRARVWRKKTKEEDEEEQKGKREIRSPHLNKGDK